MIIRGGENIYPKEIESVLGSHEAVLEAAVIGAPHDGLRRGSGRLRRRATRTPPVTAAELLELCRRNLTKIKLPVAIHVVDHLPKNAVGKIDKPALRTALQTRTPEPVTRPERIPLRRSPTMGFTKPSCPVSTRRSSCGKPIMERMRILALHWAENGYGSPRMVHTIYVAKLLFFYVLGGVVVATVTSGLTPLLARLGLVEPADRLPEADALDRAPGDDRRRRGRGARWRARSSR